MYILDLQGRVRMTHFNMFNGTTTRLGDLTQFSANNRSQYAWYDHLQDVWERVESMLEDTGD